MNSLKSTILTLLIIFILSPLWGKSILLHVSLKGNDSNSGTQAAPLASFNAAQKVLRASGRLGKEPCIVLIHAGIYRLEQALRFSPEDNGSEQFPVIWQAAGDGEVVITGARLLHTKWEQFEGDIFRTPLEGSDAIDQLFMNDERQHMARYPNFGAGFVSAGKDRFTRDEKAGNVPYDGSSPNAWDTDKAKRWNDPTGAFMHGMHRGLWGSQHYRVLGKQEDGALSYEGGWQNNRYSMPHKGYRMIENVFEELDAPCEWYHDFKEGWLYYLPSDGVDLKLAKFEAVYQNRHLMEFYGKIKQPVASLEIFKPGNGLPKMVVVTPETLKSVQNIRIEGIRFAGTSRTFMETREPLLRSDWTIYRGGAVHLRGTDNIVIENCRFEELGGNAVFVDGYNRNTVIRGNLFRKNGASDINIVGSFTAVRDPAFSYGAAARPIETIDTCVGPKNDEYPADCLIEDNLMMRCGRFEKQVAGVNLSMASRITIRHNTISHTPRAAINICDGTWGGHVIEWNDCFETVLETHDHGAFNGWGRDRIWHNANPSGPAKLDESGKALISYYVEKYPASPYWDPYQTSIIRYNRMQCDHGWDIDLDDGCTNYEIYNNLCLKGGLKTREGYLRILTNNVILGGYTCNVPYPKPTFDVFERNIVWGKKVYNSSNPILWGGSRDFTFVHNPGAAQTSSAVGLQKETMDDASSFYGNANFIAPEKGNFQVADNSPALKTGFENFPMSGFGVSSAALIAESKSPMICLPEEAAPNEYIRPKAVSIFGAKIKTIDTEAEVTATGMHQRLGTYLIDVPAKSQLAKYGLKSGDVVLMLAQTPTPSVRDFMNAIKKLKTGTYNIKVWREQELKIITMNK